MRLKTHVEWSNPERYRVVVQLPGGTLDKAVSTMKLLGVPHDSPPSHAGWYLDDGSLVLTGTQTAVEKTIADLEYRLTGPRFETGLDVAKRHKQGALPEGMT